MIDLHTHILAGIDDGAQSIQESLAMARIAASDGIKTVVATPHSADIRTDSLAAEIASRVEQLQDELTDHSIDLEIVAGLENYLVPDLARRMAEGRALALGTSNYLLVELPFQNYPPYAEQVLFDLQAMGFVPIIVHPERTAAFQEDHNLLYKLVERGMLAQVTVASLTGAFGTLAKRTAEAFLLRNLAHVIASDAHSPQWDPGTPVPSRGAPILSPGVAAAAKLVGRERAQAMVTTIPQAILRGERVDVAPLPISKPRKAWAFWR
jgi:protein-tyrosine phosphatase